MLSYTKLYYFWEDIPPFTGEKAFKLYFICLTYDQFFLDAQIITYKYKKRFCN